MNRRKKGIYHLYHISFTRYSKNSIVTNHHRYLNVYNIANIDINKYCENELPLLENDIVIINSISKLN